MAKGRKLDTFPGGKAAKATVDAMLGPTGNLRAPCIRSGRNVLVGFDEELYEKVLG